MPRIRMLFSKTGFTCFVSHIDLPIVFARAARRAGIELEMTQGFSPHSKMALSLPLPVGVTGLREPVDFWTLEWCEGYLARWNAAMPLGLKFVAGRVIGDGPSLSKCCKAASYEIMLDEHELDRAVEVLRGAAASAEAFIDIRMESNTILFATAATERFGPNHMVRALTESSAVSGWDGVFITRCDIGVWNEARREVEPLIGEGGFDV